MHTSVNQSYYRSKSFRREFNFFSQKNIFQIKVQTIEMKVMNGIVKVRVQQVNENSFVLTFKTKSYLF